MRWGPIAILVRLNSQTKVTCRMCQYSDLGQIRLDYINDLMKFSYGCGPVIKAISYIQIKTPSISLKKFAFRATISYKKLSISVQNYNELPLGKIWNPLRNFTRYYVIRCLGIIL
jgi:hypothetical protein